MVPFVSPNLGWALLSSVVVAIAALLFIARPLWNGTSSGALARWVCGFSVAHLSLGFLALAQLHRYKQRDYPIARHLPLPKDHELVRVLVTNLLGLLLLICGIAAYRSLSRKGGGHNALTRDLSNDEAVRLLRAGKILTAIGLGGALVLIASTGQIPLFSSNIDLLRYSQGSGLGFASLLEYELMAAACLAGAVWTLSQRYRKAGLLWLVVDSFLLLAVRAERTPILLTIAAIGMLRVFSGRRLKRTHVITGVALVALFTFGLGLFRFQSEVGALDSRATAARRMLDLSPEVREQGFVYRLYPSRAPLIGRRGLVADLSSIVPGKLLALAGISKDKIYTDVSRDYNLTMRRLGYYQTIAPIRVGLSGELWIDYGWPGVIVGWLLFGALVGAVSRRKAATPIEGVAKAACGAFLISALVTPMAALLPVGLMVIAPLEILRRRAIRSAEPSVSDISVAHAQASSPVPANLPVA